MSTQNERVSKPAHGGAPADSGRFVLQSMRSDAERAMQRVLAACSARQFDPTACFAIRLAMEEAFSNAIRHGNREDPRRTIGFEYRIGEDAIEVEVEDEGAGFDPDAVPDPTLDENIQIPSGRGLMLMRAYMTQVSFNERGNRVRLRLERRR